MTNTDLVDGLKRTTNHYLGVFYFTKSDAEAVAAQVEGSRVVKAARGFTVELDGRRLGPGGWK